MDDMFRFPPRKWSTERGSRTHPHRILQYSNVSVFVFNLGVEVPKSSVRAHSTRAVATSLADIRGVSPADLCQAATWSSHKVFAKYYRKDRVATTGLSTQVLSATVAEGRPDP